jgi:tellurite resistance protein TehA-like permease
MLAANPKLAPCIATALLLAPASAFAAGGRTFEGVLYASLAVSAVFLLIWAAYYFSPVHRHFMRRDGSYKRVLLPVLGLIAVAFGTTATVTGEVIMGKGSMVLRALEPTLFWRYVALQLGAGCLLIVIGLLYPTRKS